MDENVVPMKVIIKAFELMADDALDEIEAMVRKHRQARTLAEIYQKIQDFGEFPNGMHQRILTQGIISYDQVFIGDLNNWIDEALSYMGDEGE